MCTTPVLTPRGNIQTRKRKTKNLHRRLLSLFGVTIACVWPNAYPCTEIQDITSKKKTFKTDVLHQGSTSEWFCFIHFVEESSVTPFAVWLIRRMTSLSDADEGFEIKNCVGWQKTVRRIKQYEVLRDARMDGEPPSSFLSTPMGRSPR